MSREDNSHITVFVDFPGLGDLGIFENRTGGKGDSDSTKHREGGMGELRSHGGPQTMENVTVSRRYDIARDHSKYKLLMRARGRARMRVVDQPLDEYGSAVGEPVVYQGKLKAVNPGDGNANSNDIKMLELEQDTERVD